MTLQDQVIAYTRFFKSVLKDCSKIVIDDISISRNKENVYCIDTKDGYHWGSTQLNQMCVKLIGMLSEKNGDYHKILKK